MDREKSNSYDRSYLFFICTVSIIVRFYNLSGKSLWQDEQWTYVISHRGLLDIVDYLKVMADRPPLHLFFTHFSLLLGKSEFFLRLVPAIFGVTGVVALYFVGTLLFSKKEGIIAATLLSVSPYHIHYSQEATAYTLFLFFSLLSIALFFISTKEDKPGEWVKFVVVFSLTLYTSYFGLFLLAASILTVVTLWLTGHFVKNTRHMDNKSFPDGESSIVVSDKTGITFSLSVGAMVVLYLPWASVLYSSLTRYKGEGETAWGTISPSLLLDFITDFTGAGDHVTYFLLLLFFVGFICSFKNKLKEYVFIFWCTVVPFVILFILKPQYHFVSRYVIFLLPLYILGVSKGVTDVARLVNNRFKVPELYTGILVVLCISLFFLQSTGRLYATEKRDWRSSAALIENEAASGDIIVVQPPVLFYPFFYYLNFESSLKMKLIDPLIPARFVTVTLNNSKEIAVHYLPPVRIPSLLRKYKRLWFIASTNDLPQWIDETLLIKRFPGISLGWDISIYRIEVDKLFSNG